MGNPWVTFGHTAPVPIKPVPTWVWVQFNHERLWVCFKPAGLPQFHKTCGLWYYCNASCYGLTSIYRASRASWPRNSSPLLSIHTYSYPQTRLHALGLLQEVWMQVACLDSLLFWWAVPLSWHSVELTMAWYWYAYWSDDWLFPCYCS
jgi:hypothetical protein